jgi:hypothetical protein
MSGHYTGGKRYMTREHSQSYDLASVDGSSAIQKLAGVDSVRSDRLTKPALTE